MKATPNRFTKTSQGRSWNTGNGSPDAICLTVDKPGVVLVGVCVYGGGGIHEYELEVLADDVRCYNLFFIFNIAFLQYSASNFFPVDVFTTCFHSPFRRKQSTQGTRHILTDGLH